jgi:hypothetical protein
MTTTSLDIIKRSMRLLGVYAIGEDPTDAEAQDGLTALNALIGSFSNETLLVYAKTLDSISLAQGTSSVAVGPSGTTVTTRPVHVLTDSYISVNGVDYPLELWTEQQYNSIGVKSMQGLPAGIWVKPDMPDVTVCLWPVPSEAMTLKLWSAKPITGTLTLATSLSLPPGYERMLAYVLAEDMAPEYQVEPSPTVVRKASAARKVLKRTNAEIPQMDMPYGVPPVRGFLDIRQL